MTLEIITDTDLAPFRHGFFTRRGGASSGVFEGLNCGYGSSDQHEIVSINRQRVAESLDLENAALCGVHQIHSADVVSLSSRTNELHRADALVTRAKGIGLSILTADCQPVLFADADNGVIGAAHAGWKGALAGVLDATVDAMVGIGAQRDRIRAVVGPSISQRAYEVGPEFFDLFVSEDDDNARFFAQGEADRMLFDLPAYGLHRLRNAGVGSASWTRHCTYSDATRFFSYRRATHNKDADYGRLISVIRS